VTLVITVGLPGSGKSSYLARLGANPISSDEIRRLITDNPHDQAMNARIFAVLRYLVRQRLRAGRPVTYVDATHLTPWERQPYVGIAKLFQCELEAIFFDVPLEVCMVRNLLRERIVPPDAIREMAQKLIPPSLEEGFTRVTTISDPGVR
jgi:predicted kinase